MNVIFWERDYDTATDTYDWPAMPRRVPLDKPYEIWVLEPSDSTATDTPTGLILADIMERYADAWSALADM